MKHTELKKGETVYVMLRESQGARTQQPHQVCGVVETATKGGLVLQLDPESDARAWVFAGDIRYVTRVAN